MKNCLLTALLAGPIILSAWDSSRDVRLVIRGKNQSVALLASATGNHDRAILFLPGDGGWRGMAIRIAETMTRWGYDVYGFDTKRYLESFSENGTSLTPDLMRQDIQTAARWIRARGARRVVIVGWSQGAAMGVLAATDKPDGIDGVITLGLPQSAVLGWNWKDSLTVLARREPDEPHFSVGPLMRRLAPVPLWMIHGTEDEYTTPEQARILFAGARDPRRLVEIQGGNHHFDGRLAEFYRALQEGLEWVGTQSPYYG